MKMSLTFKSALLFCFLATSSFEVAAQSKKPKVAAPKEANPSDPAVMDFDSDVIEGQRMRPDIFNQSGTEGLTLDAILYLRNDFNDLHQVEQKRRPKYLEKKKGN